MVEVSNFSQYYVELIDRFALGNVQAVNIFLLTVLITIASIFIFKFYRSISQKDILSLNLKRYNRSKRPTISKLYHVALFFLEYIIIMPIVILLWFTALSVLILLIASERSIVPILTITGAMVASIRVLAYHREEISKDLAKLFPFIALSVFLLSPGAFDFSRIFSQVSEIPKLLNSVVVFLVFVFAVEIILRIFYTIYEFFQSGEEEILEE